MRQLTTDGRQEDVVIGRNVQDHLFTAPQTMKGQLPMPARDLYLGKCKRCSHGSRVALGDVQTYCSETRHTVDTARPFRNGYGPVCAKCPQHGVYRLQAINGRVVPGHKCDARCTGAYGSKCDCSCGGVNHGADHA